VDQQIETLIEWFGKMQGALAEPALSASQQ